MDAAKKAQTTGVIGNVANTGTSMLGMDWLRNKQLGTPDNSLLHEGWQGTKNIFNSGMDKIGNPFGMGSPEAAPDYTGMGSLAPAAPVGGAAPAAGGGAGAIPMAAPVPAAAPDVTASLATPENLGIGSLTPAAAAPAVAAPAAADTAADASADAGLGFTGYGAIAGASDLADRTLVRPLVNKMFGSNDTGKVIEDVFNPLGAVHDLVGTWICSATAKYSYMTREEEATMKKLRTYAQENYAGWWDSYFKYGTQLVKEIADQETDLTDFYENIRKILVEPVIQTFDKNPEKAFQIYLFVTQTLFKAYMPEFEFKEIE